MWIEEWEVRIVQHVVIGQGCGAMGSEGGGVRRGKRGEQDMTVIRRSFQNCGIRGNNCIRNC